MPDSLHHGRICYVEIPARDVALSAGFYHRVFGWRIRTRANGTTAFDDTTGQVSGGWVLGRPPSTQPGVLLYIAVSSVTETVDAILFAGGEIAQPLDPDSGEIIALFHDPAGNVLGLYQHPGERATREAAT